jgi:hypothetical protein
MTTAIRNYIKVMIEDFGLNPQQIPDITLVLNLKF